MKKVGELVTQPWIGSAGPAASTDTKMVSRLWLRMTEIYGHKWSSSYGETPSETWSRGISGMSFDELKRGLSECLNSGNAWPPSLPEFLAMCKPTKRENAAMYRNVPQLPAPVSDKATAAANLAKLRQMVRA
jgi:hypothetical protein